MRKFNLFKRTKAPPKKEPKKKEPKKREGVTKEIIDDLFNEPITKATPNTFMNVSRKRFVEELAKLGFEPEQWFGTVDYAHASDEFQIFVGDIEQKGTLRFKAMNLLVMGSISTEWLDAANEIGEGGTLFVANQVICDFFSNYYGKLVVVGGDLHANKMINNEFYDAALVVKKNLKTAYFHGVDIWAEVGGNIEMTYGNGYCLPIGYDDPGKQHVKPQHDYRASKEFLGIKDDDNESLNVWIESKLVNK